MNTLRFILLLAGSLLFAQKQVLLEEIADHIGKKVKVCDKIYGTYIIPSNGLTLLNVGQPYPDNPLTLAIFKKDLKNFSYVPAEFLLDKSICVTGKLVLFKGKPEIILNTEKDIEIQEETLEIPETEEASD